MWRTPFEGVQRGQGVSAGQQAQQVGTQEVASLMHGHALPIASIDHSASRVDHQGFYSSSICYLHTQSSVMLPITESSVLPLIGEQIHP